MITAITSLGSAVVGGISGYFKRKQELTAAIHENKVKLALSEQSYNQEWEMRQLDNSGWKDDVLFYAILLMFVWSAFDPEAAAKVFENWKMLPPWFLEITGWLVASVIGVKKVGEYLPGLLSGVKQVLKEK